MQEIKEGNILIVRVKNIKKYGFFVTIDNSVDALVHISEISDNYVKAIDKFVTVGEVILARVIGIEGGRANLSIKNMNYKLRKTCLRYLEKDFVVDKNFWTIEEKIEGWVKEYYNENS